jgi:MFS family permease
VIPIVVLVSLLTFLHYVGAQMRAAPVLPLYAAAHGASATGVGFVIGAHMAVAAVGSIPLGRASDVWGRRPLLFFGMIVGVLTTLLLPLAHGELALTAIYGLAGFGVAAFTPSALSLVGDAAPPGRAGHAFAWYTTAHYGAIALGPFLGGLVADRWGYRAAFFASAAVIGAALVGGLAVPARATTQASPRPGVAFAEVKGNAKVWAGWIISIAGFILQGVVFTFFPLLGQERGLTPAAIGVVFLVLGLANTIVRFPAGWLVDRSGRATPYALGGVLVASFTTALVPQVHGQAALLALFGLFGAVSGVAFVAIGVALADSTAPTARGLVMGGYSTALYLGLSLGSFALGPVISHYGYAVGFGVGGAAGMVGTLVAGLLWATGNGGETTSAEPSLGMTRPDRRVGR